MSFLLEVFPHVGVIFKSSDRLFHFLSARCVERHLNYLSLAVKRPVIGGGTFAFEGVLRSHTGVLPKIDLLLTRLSNQNT